MVTLSPASVVIVPFPFSDLSGTKLRPALVVAETRKKLFTANRSLIVKRVAVLKLQTFRKVLTTTIESLQKNMDEVQ